MTILHTDRFLLRPWTIEDAPAAFRMYGDPEVTRYLGTGGSEPNLESQTKNLGMAIERYTMMAADGYGFWAVEDRQAREIVGSGLLKPLVLSDGEVPGDQPEVEVGWHVARACWGKGIATEMGRELVRHAFETVGLPHVLSIAYPENAKSTHVMKKLGMHNVGLSSRYYNVPNLAVYRLERPNKRTLNDPFGNFGRQ